MSRYEGFPFLSPSNPPLKPTWRCKNQEYVPNTGSSQLCFAGHPNRGTPIRGLEQDSRYSKKILLRIEEGGY
jgi:hypothetical protein